MRKNIKILLLVVVLVGIGLIGYKWYQGQITDCCKLAPEDRAEIRLSDAYSAAAYK